MKQRVLIVIFLLLSIVCLPQQTKPLVIGEQITFESEELNESRTINVYLPHGYHPDSAKTYPVIYLLDGSMHEDMLHITGLVQFCSYSWIDIIPECIVVGISNVNRYRDFTHVPENKEYLESDPRRGGADPFINFLSNEVQPMIYEKYKTNEHRILIGQSLGGLIATQILVERPELFNHYMIISPSLWYDDERLLAAELPTTNLPKSVYVAVGKEGKIMKSVANKLYQKINKTYDNVEVAFQYFPKHDHGDVLHAAIYHGFERIGFTFKE
jgi:predicted alpha/beta superfamily hydrolase